jgi:hypothetical protein
MVLAERRSGYIIMLVGSLFALGMPVIRDGRGRCFSRRDRQVQPSLLVCLDASRAGHDWDVLPHPLSARTMEPAAGPAPVVRYPNRHGGDEIEIFACRKCQILPLLSLLSLR